MEHLLYELRLSWHSLRRDRLLTLAMLVGYTLSTALWSLTMAFYLRTYWPALPLAPTLHQVEIDRPDLDLSRMNPLTRLAVRSSITWEEYRALARTGIPTRQTGLVRSRVVVAGGPLGAPPAGRVARFVSGDFFTMFPRPFRAGGPFPRADEAAGAAVTVLGERLARVLFGEREAVGASIDIDGESYRVVGVLAGDQPYRSDWDLTSITQDQDLVYLPMTAFLALRARPEAVFARAPLGPDYEQLLASDALFASFWADLPTKESRLAYTVHLERALEARGARFHLRALGALRAEIDFPPSPVSFFASFSAVILLGGGFGLMRMLLAKGLARAEQIGVHRALGATVGAIFLRQLLEAAMVALASGVLAVALMTPFLNVYYGTSPENDIPLRMTGLLAAVTILPALGLGLLAGLYPAWRLSRVPPTLHLGRS
jgi:putative ABC transport system permease protein